MNNIYFVLSLLLVMQINAQTINEPANWPNSEWTITGSFSDNAGVFESSPLDDFTFAYDDNGAGNGVTNQIAVESPVIDLTDAFNNGEALMRISNVIINNYNDPDVETLVFQWWDADASTWNNIGDQLPETANAPEDMYCTGTSENYLTEFDISSFTATQLSGFRYRINYDDGGERGFGFCMTGPILRSVSCFDITDLAVDNITVDGVNVSWTPAGNEMEWEYEVQLENSGVPTGSGTNTTEPEATISGLNDTMVYEIYVRSKCSDTNFGDWIGPVVFRPGCLTINTYPWTENFEGVTPSDLPFCFSEINNNNDANSWQTFFGGGVGFSIGAGLTASPLFNSPGDNDDYLILPQMNITGSQRLIFSSRIQNNGNGSTGNFRVVLSTTGTDPEDFTEELLPLTMIDGNDDQEIIVNELVNYFGDIYIAFHVPETEQNSFRIFIDNIRVEGAPDCLDVSNVTQIDGSESSVTIGWDQSISGETQWEYALQTPGSGEPSMGILTSQNPVTINGLTAGTEYEFYIRSICSGGELGDWIGPFEVRASCNSISMFPWSEDFQSGITLPELPDCWRQIDNNDDGDTWESAGFGGINGAGSLTIFTDQNQGNNDDYLILPQFTLTGNERMFFDYRVQLNADPNDFRVVLSTTDFSPESFTEELLPLTESDDSSLEGSQAQIDLSAYSGNVYIAVHIPNGGLDGFRLFLDNFRIEEIPDCLEISDLELLDLTSTDVTIGWTTQGTETAWEYALQPAGTGEPTEAGIATMDNPTLIENLTPDTDYEVWVRANCGGTDGFSTWVGPIEFRTGYCVPTVIGENEHTFVNSFFTTGGVTNIENLGTGFSEDGYENYSENMILESWVGGDFTYFVQAGFAETANFVGCAILVDWNNDLTLDQDTELIFSTNDLSFSTGPFEGSYTVPDGVDLGDYRMRVVIHSGDQTPGACDAWFGLEAEDYTLRIGEGPTCREVEDITIQNITASSVDVTWTEGESGETAWEYVVQLVGEGVPSGNGNSTTTNPTTVSNLEPITEYEVWVRADCGNDDFSVWVGPVIFQTRLLNDDCEGAIDLIVGSTFDENVIPASVESAADDGLESECTSVVGLGPGVWYTLTVPELAPGADLFIETGGDLETGNEDFDSVIQVYTGECGILTYIDCDDESGVNSLSRVRLEEGEEIFAGDVLYILVWEWAGDEDEPFSISAYSDSILSTVETTKKNSFAIYPNPTSESLFIKSKYDIESSVIFNATGQRVAEFKSETELNVRNLPQGVYFIQILADNGTLESLKFIKR